MIRLSDCSDAVLRFEAFHDEVAAGHVLKVVHKEYVDDGTAGGTNYRNGFRRHLLGHNDAEASGDRGDQAHDCRRGAFYGATLRDVSCGFGNGFGERSANGPIAALGGIVRL